MPLFKKKVKVFAAEQYLPDKPLPAGVHPANVREEADRPYVITAHNQRVYLELGDWIIAEPDGRGYYPVKPDIFANDNDPLEV